MFKNLRNMFFESVASEEQVNFFKFANKVAETINLVISSNKDNERFIVQFNQSLNTRIHDSTRPVDEIACLKYMQEIFNTNGSFDVISMSYTLRHYSRQTVEAAIKSVISCCSRGCSGLVLAEKEIIQLNAGLMALRDYIGKVAQDPIHGGSQPCTTMAGKKEFTFQNSDEACAAVKEVITCLNVALSPPQ